MTGPITAKVEGERGGEGRRSEGWLSARWQQVTEWLRRIWPPGTWALSGLESRDVERRVLRSGLMFAGVGFAVQGGLHLVNVIFFGLDLDVINADSDTAAFSWLSVAAEFTPALAAFLLATILPRARGRFFGLAATCAFFSADDMLQIHEKLTGGWTTSPGLPSHFGRMIWPAVFFPVLALAFILLWGLSLQVRRDVARFIQGGLLLLVASIILEVTSATFFYVGIGHGDVPYELEVVLEEGAELAGWVLIAAALTALTTTSLMRLGADAQAAKRDEPIPTAYP
jgi:hypothetical protein